ncbi:PP2C family protein-serine/threonine phosphatase [Nocardia arthritidis]|uniref:Serine/threonine protein phosphatase n=1 Tax=Nocardia arthritidis TaxID=228602 RepID=A0A6G9YIF0_9NOCA|nr:serine/threonine protein phosphatase [Nocardia arthritidis]QIS12971.1 serine/threonine protein phosphatase [Nocardia arthritidis]
MHTSATTLILHPLMLTHVSGEPASRRGMRAINADAVATRTDPRTGRTAFAVADGVGDHLLSARAARTAATVAAEVAAHSGAHAGILAAQEELLREFPQPEADSVLVVAVLPATGGPDGPSDIAWVGDCRAYRWNGRVLHQITTDHTVAEYFRARGLTAGRRMNHLVTTSARTARPATIGRASTGSSHGRILLGTDGVTKVIPMAEIKTVLANAVNPAVAANMLVDSALRAGGTDNATAYVVDCR